MNTSGDFGKRIDEAMSSLDNIRRAPAPDFLFTRVQAVINTQDSQVGSVLFQWMMRPAVTYLLVLLILILNLWVIFGASTTPVKGEPLYAVDYGVSMPQEEMIYTINSEEKP